MYLIKLKEERARLETEYAAKRSLLDSLIDRFEEMDALALAPAPDRVLLPGATPTPAAPPERKSGRKNNAHDGAGLRTGPGRPKKLPPPAKMPAVPGRRCGEETVSAAIREVLAAKPVGLVFKPAEMGQWVAQKFPALGELPEFSTKIASALFNLRTNATLDLVQRDESNRPIYKLLKSPAAVASLFNQIHSEVDAKIQAQRAALGE